MNEQISNEQLMLQYANGEISAFEQLYARHKGGLYRYCLRNIQNTAKAEECFQEIWLKLINSRTNYQPKALFTTYLYRIAQNCIIDSYRKHKKISLEIAMEEDQQSQQSMDIECEISNHFVEQNTYQQLRKQIELLPLEQKTALLLQLDAGLSLDEIACILECGRETVKSRLRYACVRLKKQLGELV